MRKWIVLIASLALALGMAAAPASATLIPKWHGTSDATAVCDTESGMYVVTYTIDSWNEQYPGVVKTRLGEKKTPAVYQEEVPGDSASASLAWSMTWEGSRETSQGVASVELSGDCEGLHRYRVLAGMPKYRGDIFKAEAGLVCEFTLDILHGVGTWEIVCPGQPQFTGEWHNGKPPFHSTTYLRLKDLTTGEVTVYTGHK